MVEWLRNRRSHVECFQPSSFIAAKINARTALRKSVRLLIAQWRVELHGLMCGVDHSLGRCGQRSERRLREATISRTMA